jgi:GDP-L-fucose synthase
VRDMSEQILARGPVADAPSGHDTALLMRREDRIHVAGHRGLVGSAIVRRLRAGGYRNLLLRTREQLDLTRQSEVDAFYAAERPDHVFIAAARVGGIAANSSQPASFLHDNLAIATNLIEAACRNGARRLLFLGSSCIYPREAPQPLSEDALLAGPLEPTNEAYAVAKIAGVKMCAAYNRQYGTEFFSAMPCNLYGPGDNYDLEGSHLLPALIRKAHAARRSGATQLVVWGSGEPLREFLWSDDLAAACVLLMSECSACDIGDWINVGSGVDHRVADVARLVARVVGFEGELVFDPTRPDGTPRKLLDSSRMRTLGWQPSTSLERGIELAYHDYVTRFAGGVRL